MQGEELAGPLCLATVFICGLLYSVVCELGLSCVITVLRVSSNLILTSTYVFLRHIFKKIHSSFHPSIQPTIHRTIYPSTYSTKICQMRLQGCVGEKQMGLHPHGDHGLVVETERRQRA